MLDSKNKVKVLITKAFKYRFYPNKTQELALKQTFGNVRFVWNQWVESFNDKNKPHRNVANLKKEFEFLNDCSCAALQQKERDFLEFKRQFFSKTRKKKVGRPSFKSVRDHQSYRLTNQKFKVDHDAGKVRLEKIGWVKFDNHRVIPDDAKFISITISKTTNGKYYLSICTQLEVTPTCKNHLPNVGIDLGIKTLAFLSDGTDFGNPTLFSKNQTKLRTAQKHLSRKKKGSTRYNKQKLKVAKIYEKITNTRA